MAMDSGALARQSSYGHLLTLQKNLSTASTLVSYAWDMSLLAGWVLLPVVFNRVTALDPPLIISFRIEDPRW